MVITAEKKDLLKALNRIKSTAGIYKNVDGRLTASQKKNLFSDYLKDIEGHLEVLIKETEKAKY